MSKKTHLINGKLFSSIIFFVLSIFIASDTFAATVPFTGIKKLVHYADVIVVGEYVNVTSAFNKNKIYTTASLRVEKTIKGEVEDILKVKVLGGTAIHPRLNAPVTMNVSNSVKFVQDSSVFVFLKKNNDDTYQVVGMSKGNIVVVTDDAGKRYMGGGINKISSYKDKGTALTTIHSKKMELEHFIKYIETLIQQGK